MRTGKLKKDRALGVQETLDPKNQKNSGFLEQIKTRLTNGSVPGVTMSLGGGTSAAHGANMHDLQKSLQDLQSMTQTLQKVKEPKRGFPAKESHSPQIVIEEEEEEEDNKEKAKPTKKKDHNDQLRTLMDINAKIPQIFRPAAESLGAFSSYITQVGHGQSQAKQVQWGLQEDLSHFFLDWEQSKVLHSQHQKQMLSRQGIYILWRDNPFKSLKADHCEVVDVLPFSEFGYMFVLVNITCKNQTKPVILKLIAPSPLSTGTITNATHSTPGASVVNGQGEKDDKKELPSSPVPWSLDTTWIPESAGGGSTTTTTTESTIKGMWELTQVDRAVRFFAIRELTLDKQRQPFMLFGEHKNQPVVMTLDMKAQKVLAQTPLCLDITQIVQVDYLRFSASNDIMHGVAFVSTRSLVPQGQFEHCLHVVEVLDAWNLKTSTLHRTTENLPTWPFAVLTHNSDESLHNPIINILVGTEECEIRIVKSPLAIKWVANYHQVKTRPPEAKISQSVLTHVWMTKDVRGFCFCEKTQGHPRSRLVIYGCADRKIREEVQEQWITMSINVEPWSILGFSCDANEEKRWAIRDLKGTSVLALPNSTQLDVYPRMIPSKKNVLCFGTSSFQHAKDCFILRV
jgi:hypothetical protein